MGYTNSADIYLGDVSSQVYEFVRQPRPCIFLNLDHIAWREHDNFAHWHLGQVVEQLTDLPKALENANALQPRFEATQRDAIDHSISLTGVPASKRQAEAIIELDRKSVVKGKSV